jgi:hypothetical protein
MSYDPVLGITPDLAGGGTLGQVLTQLDPKKMQRKLVNGQLRTGLSTPIHPHQHDL